jgi:hypothetical protein
LFDNAIETVEGATPASRATSRIVTFDGLLIPRSEMIQ